MSSPPSNQDAAISVLASQLASSSSATPAIEIPATTSSQSRPQDKDATSDIGINTAADVSQPSSPITPRRLSFPSRFQLSSRGPLSPVLDPALGYSVARRPRMDFARACTQLHHSTLAQSSPDASPLSTNGTPIPRNKSLDSPISTQCPRAPSHASSLGSTSMLDSDDENGSSSDDEAEDMDLMAISTTAPRESKLPRKATRAGLRSGRKPASSSGNGIGSTGNSGLNSPSPATPSMLQTAFGGIQRASLGVGARRRDSVTKALRESAMRDSVDFGRYEPVTNSINPDPIRRPVSRRGSLLPKTKNFQRIKADLLEEAAPIDIEVKREAEITRQIRGDDVEEQSPPLNFGGREENEEDDSMSSSDSTGMSFSKQAQRHSIFQMEGIESAPQFSGSRVGSDGDITMNSDSTTNSPGPVPAEMRRAKRRRTEDDYYEPTVLKRRAVSPSLSHSPILASSPNNGSGGRRLNFQGLTDTNDSLMKMSLQ